MAIVFLCTAVGAETTSQRINGQVQHIPVGDPEKEVLICAQTLVQPAHNLVLVAPAARRSGEVIGEKVGSNLSRRTCGIGRGKKL